MLIFEVFSKDLDTTFVQHKEKAFAGYLRH